MLNGDTMIHDVVVVAFDMCSSSNIIEDLTRTNNLIVFDRLLKRFHGWLKSNSRRYNYAIYKFTGDGWILLFPTDGFCGKSLIEFLIALSKQHRNLWKKYLEDHSESIPEIIGLKFRVETGPVRQIVFDGQREFVGRALNVACRLQNSVKDKGKSPDYRVLLSRVVDRLYDAGVPALFGTVWLWQ